MRMNVEDGTGTYEKVLQGKCNVHLGTQTLYT